MAYITFEKYNAIFPNSGITPSEFAMLSFYAETAINNYTDMQFSEPVSATIERAMALQINASFYNGGVEYYTSSSEPVASESIGGYSYSTRGAESSSAARSNSTKLETIVMDMLRPYVFRGVNVRL